MIFFHLKLSVLTVSDTPVSLKCHYQNQAKWSLSFMKRRNQEIEMSLCCHFKGSNVSMLHHKKILYVDFFRCGSHKSIEIWWFFFLSFNAISLFESTIKMIWTAQLLDSLDFDLNSHVSSSCHPSIISWFCYK